jgi:ABC-2 type transport system permease protein
MGEVAVAQPPQDAAVPPLVSPAATNGLFEVFRRRYLLKLLVRREITARYSGSFLGMFWSYVQPAVKLAMYYFLFQVLIGRGANIENFAIHVYSGLVVVHYFTETFQAGTRSIVRNRGVIQKMAIPREMFPVASMLVSAYNVVPGLLLLTGFCFFLGWSPDPVGMLAGVLGFTIVMLLGTALALMFSVANVLFRDFSNVVQTLTQFVTFSVPMIYPYSLVEERFGPAAQFYLLNPIAEAVLLVQRCFWVGTTSDPAETVRLNMPDNLFPLAFAHIAGALVLLGVAQVVFWRLENKIPERL